MSFKKDKYIIIRKAISKDLANFNLNYLLVKKQVFETCLKTRYISPYEDMLGNYEDEDTGQVLHTYSCYADIAMETLMLKCQPLIEKATGLKLYPAYSYARAYKKGDELKRHKDRFSCEISSTMNLGGDDWPIYVSPHENVGVSNGKDITHVSKAKGVRVDLKPGDMLVYKGIEIEHWREKFKKKECVQVFFHYNDSKTPGAQNNMFDKRPHLGLPSWFIKRNV
jgi:hypothetical protein